MTRRSIAFCAALTLLTTLAACSGGGGGSDQVEINGVTYTRSTKTGVRILHAAIDAVPLSLAVEDTVLQTARYSQATQFVEVEKGPVILKLEQANSAGMVISSVSTELADDTEYSLLVYGGTDDSSFNVALLSEPIERPDEGKGRLQLVNAYDRGVTATFENAEDSETISALSLGSSSGLRELTSGPQTVTIRNSSGSVIARRTVDLVDRTDVTLVVMGSKDLGVVFVSELLDLD